MAAPDEDKGSKPENEAEDVAKDASMAEAKADATATGESEKASATSNNTTTDAANNPPATSGAKAGTPPKKAGPGRRGSMSTPKTPGDNNNNKKRQSMAQGAIAATTPGDTPGTVVQSPAPAQDLHPYARSAVIEVLYIPAQAVGKTTATIQEASSSDPWYWSEDSSLCSTTSSSSAGGDNEEEDDDDDNDNGGGGSKKRKDPPKDKDCDVSMEDAKETKAATQGAQESNKETSPSSKAKERHHHHHHHHHQNAASVRLCDIIDRAPVVNEDGTEATNAAGQPQAWRYYVHYKDFNRRMDEWIGMDRIVSPPSVGNAKARALKREEEKQKKKQQRLEEKQRAEQQKKEQKILGDLDVTAPRSSRRRSTTGATPATSGSLSPAVGGAPGGGVAGAAGGAATDAAGRKTRLRRKSTNAGEDDAATVVAGNQDEDAADEKAPIGIKEILTLPAGTSNMATTIVGEHVVATVAAQEIDEHEGLDEASLREHEEITKVKNVSFIELGRHQMETWYFSPIPKELLSARGYIEVLCVCEFTFRMFARKSELQRFQQRSLRPQDRHPPGNEIYRKGNLSMFEVDGLTERIYCQNLSYIAKLFLDHKTLYFDVDPFLFYVLCEVDDRGYHPVGYYSKEKYSDVGYNLACILTFPAHQRKGYGRFLIAFSYELSKKQEKVGGPERPVSDLGQMAYKPYWAATVVDFLRFCDEERDADGNILSSSLSIMDISKRTSVMAEDIVFALNQLGILKIISGVYFIAAEKNLLENLAKKWPVKEPRVDPTRLHWTPFLTDIKRDKFSIHSKKANVEGFVRAVPKQPKPEEQMQSGEE